MTAPAASEAVAAGGRGGRGARPSIAHAFAYVVLLFWCSPLWWGATRRGAPTTPDWEWFLSYYEVVRTTLLRYGEFPGQNAWMYLGSPLWGNAQIGPISHFTLLTLPFGPVLGFKLGIVVNVLISFEAARLLGRRLFQHPTSAVVAGLLYALNPAIASHWILGQGSFANYAFAPLLVLACLRLGEARWAGLWAGVIAGVMMHYGIGYFFVYALLSAAVLVVALAVRRRATTALVRFGALFLLAFLALCAFRLLPVLAVMRDYPRKLYVPIDLSARQLVDMFFTPELGAPRMAVRVPQGPITYQLTTSELAAYAGVTGVLFALVSLRRGLKAQHVGVVVSLLLLLGNVQAWQPSRWLSGLPIFDSMWVVTRWRIVLLGCLAFCTAEGVDVLLVAWKERTGPVARAVRALAFVPALELVAVLFGPFAGSVCPYEEGTLTRAQLHLPETPEPLALRRLRLGGSDVVVFFNPFRANLGIVEGYEPLFGYLPARSARLYVGHPDYRGEFTVDGARVEPSHWSPNRLVVEGLPPGRTLTINRNPGRGWSQDGTPLFEDLRVFELERAFVVTIPPSGRVDLRYVPPGLARGAWLSIGCAAALVAWWLVERRRAQARLRCARA